MKIPHACLVCGLPFGSKHGLCGHCGPRLFQLREPRERQETHLTVRSLFSWRRDGWPALDLVATRLKGQDSAEAWLELATWFISAWPTSVSGLLVPVPSSGRNHALGWARALGVWTGYPVRELLSKTSKQTNKSLDRRGRAQLRFAGPDGHVDQCTKYIIVDDIITTGATVRAAYAALRRPRNCEVWCLMDRRPWQG